MLQRFLIVCSILIVLCETVAPEEEAKLELQFVQALWRHGDRAALMDLYPISKTNWTFGGGGFGELTPVGMAQLLQLGGMLRKRYVTDQEFLSSRYHSREIYVRSTDVNRTIQSAHSLLYGLYPPGGWTIQGVDYPNSPDWHQGFTFIPVHIDGKDECDVTQSCGCPRLTFLKEKFGELPEVQTSNAKMLAMNRQIAAYYNVSENGDYFSIYPDTWKCQRNYFNETLYEKLPWYNEQVYEDAQRAYAPMKGYMEGRFENSSVYGGVDIAKETRIIVAGPLINELWHRAHQKLECSLKEDCSGYTKSLKFYGYSSHDMIIHALLVIFEIPDLVKTIDGWPDYASAIVFEFYSNPATSETFFKMLYRDNADEELASVTEKIPMCNGASFCSMQNFQNLADLYRPLPDFGTLCQTMPKFELGTSGAHSSLLSILMISLFLIFTHCIC